MTEFITKQAEKIKLGRLIYRKDENSFDFTPSMNADIILLISYLNIGIDSETMKVQQLWGLCPFNGWTKQKLEIPQPINGELLTKGDLQPGMTYRIYENKDWTVKYDPQTGWVCIGETDISESDDVIQFAQNSISVVSDLELKSLWLKPDFI